MGLIKKKENKDWFSVFQLNKTDFNIWKKILTAGFYESKQKGNSVTDMFVFMLLHLSFDFCSLTVWNWNAKALWLFCLFNTVSAAQQSTPDFA